MALSTAVKIGIVSAGTAVGLGTAFVFGGMAARANDKKALCGFGEEGLAADIGSRKTRKEGISRFKEAAAKLKAAEAKAEPKPEAKAEPKPEAKAEPKPEAKAAEA